MSAGAFHYGQRRLENDLVALEPFNPSIHAARFVEVIKSNPDLFTYTPFPKIDSKEDFLEFYDKHIGAAPGECLYAIFDKTGIFATENPDRDYAGTISLIATNPDNAATEIGIVIFPAFQRTHIATNAIGLLLLWTLDPPRLGGLGLRRVEWKTHTDNAASRKAALRMGFEFEGVARWHSVLPGGKIALPVEALEVRNGTKGEHPGRHMAIYSIVWDEWDEKRPKVVALMNLKR